LNFRLLGLNMTAKNVTIKAAWVEPEVLTLNVLDTAIFPGRGGDGSMHLDCTRS
jgi:hypothetical protein